MRLAKPVVILLVVAGVGASGWLAASRWSGPRASRPASSVVSAPSPAAAVVHLAYAPTPLGAPLLPTDRPQVTDVQLADLDQDGLLDVLYAEGVNNSVRWIRQAPRGMFTETVIGADIRGPAHVATADLNGTGRLDVLVASMGQIMPSNERIGAVVVLENLGGQRFQKRVLLDRVARVTDVRAANLAGHPDNRLDLVVGQFGYAQGETRWMENKGNWNFESRVVNLLSGCVHTPPADFDGDGLVDFAALISQEWEEVHLFRNLGRGQFAETIVWGSTNEDFGSSGLAVADLNRDGRPDLIYTNGDGFDYAGFGSRAWHGVQWLENQGGGRFAYHRIGDMPGAYAPCAADLDNDGDLDLVSVGGFADWSSPTAVSMMAWVNDGRQRFTPVVLAHRPTHLVAAAVGDLDGTEVPVIVTGGFHAFAPYDHTSSVTVWRKK